jgi:hypothetical protein
MSKLSPKKLNWGKLFEEIDLHLKKKDYTSVKVLIDMGKREACKNFMDPRFILQELKQQEQKLPK